jgi:hypothetical protein
MPRNSGAFFITLIAVNSQTILHHIENQFCEFLVKITTTAQQQ